MPLGQRELAIIRDRAKKLRDGRLKTRGDALLPTILASFVFDSLCASQGFPTSPYVLRFFCSISVWYMYSCMLCLIRLAQWLGRRSLAGGLPWSTPDLWLTCDHFVSKVSAMGQPTRPTQPSIPWGSVNSAFHPFGVGKWVVIHAVTWITGVETIKWQTRLCVAG